MTLAAAAWTAVSASAPLDPSGDEARRALRRELLRPEYVADDPIQRLLDLLERLADRAVGTAQDLPPVVAAIAVLVVLLLVTAAVLLLSRARTSARARSAEAPVLTSDLPSADVLRARAEQALREGRPGDALVDGFRAAALRQIERGRIDDVPQATAHELAVTLARAFPESSADLARSADLFDAVLYGERPCAEDDARAVLGLDDALSGSRAGLR